MPIVESQNLCCPAAMASGISAFSENYLAIPLNEKGNVAVWKVQSPLETPVILIGHHKTVTALSLSYEPSGHYLCSCSKDNIILWNLLQNAGSPNRGKVLQSDIDQPIHSSFSRNNLKVAVCTVDEILVFNITDWSCTTLNIEGSQMSCCIYAWNDLLFTIDDKNLLKVWNDETNKVLWRTRLSSGFITAAHVHSHSNHVAVGTASGRIFVYADNFQIRNIEIWRVLRHFVKKEPIERDLRREFESDCSFPVYALYLFFHSENQSHLNSVLPKMIYVLAVTSSCFFIMNINNEELIFHQDFNDPSCENDEESRMGLIRSAIIGTTLDNSLVYINTVPVLGDAVVLLKVGIKEIIERESKKYCNELNGDIELSGNNLRDEVLTFLRSEPKKNDSKLSVHNLSIISEPPPTRRKVPKSRSSLILNLPVTHHDKVKSSGYGASNRSIMFQPQISKPSRQQKSSSHMSISTRSIYKSMQADSLLSFKPADLQLLSKLKFAGDPNVTNLQISADGNYALCNSSEGYIDVINIGRNNAKVISTLSCHKGAVNSAKWSHNGKQIITSGSDKTAKIWNSCNLKQEPDLTLGCTDDSFKSLKKGSPLFEDSVEAAQFYYLDQYILASSQNYVHLIDYSINLKSTGIKNYINKSCSKLRAKIPIKTKRITAMAATNQFRSNIVLCAGSSKCLATIDMNTGAVVWSASDIGLRAAHLIALNEGSPTSDQLPFMYDLFMTSSLSDGIKVWDLRSKNVVMCYKEHKCRSIPCGAAFSAYGSCIATGSEDKAVYVYDLRQTARVCKFIEHDSDVMTGISFSPIKHQLLASSLNGTLFFYGEKTLF